MKHGRYPKTFVTFSHKSKENIFVTFYSKIDKNLSCKKSIPTEWKIEDPEMNSGWHFIFSKTSANSPYREDTID